METVGDTRKEQQCLQQSSQRVVRTMVVVTREPRAPGAGSVGRHHNTHCCYTHCPVNRVKLIADLCQQNKGVPRERWGPPATPG